MFGPPQALPAAPKPVTVLGFADELLRVPDLFNAFIASFAGQDATLLVLGTDWEEDALDNQLAMLGAPDLLFREGLDLVVVCAPAGGSVEQDLAELVDMVFTHGTPAVAFRYVMRVDPPASGQPRLARLGRLSPDPVGPPLPLYVELPGLQPSRLCNEEQFRAEDYAFWCGEFGQKPAMHRKQWEYVFICKALHERGLLAPGRRGIGFGVGSEPLPAAASPAVRALRLRDRRHRSRPLGGRRGRLAER